MNNYKIIDLNSWDRKATYEFFHAFQDQLFSTDFDLTLPKNFAAICKQAKLSPFVVFLYAFGTGLNKIENFRYRMLNDDIVLFDRVDPGWVELDVNKNLVIVKCQYTEDFKTFCSNVQNRSVVKAQDLLDDPAHFTVSSNHWVKWSSIKHTRLRDNETNQKLVLGQLDDDKVRLSFEVSHLFVDGYYVSLFKNEVEKSLAKLLE